jgi:hypothetical protein
MNFNVNKFAKEQRINLADWWSTSYQYGASHHKNLRSHWWHEALFHLFIPDFRCTSRYFLLDFFCKSVAPPYLRVNTSNYDNVDSLYWKLDLSDKGINVGYEVQKRDS